MRREGIERVQLSVTECAMLGTVFGVAMRTWIFALAMCWALLCEGAVSTGDPNANDVVKAAASGWDGLALKMRNVTGQVDWVKNLRSTKSVSL